MNISKGKMVYCAFSQCQKTVASFFLHDAWEILPFYRAGLRHLWIFARSIVLLQGTFSSASCARPLTVWKMEVQVHLHYLK